MFSMTTRPSIPWQENTVLMPAAFKAWTAGAISGSRTSRDGSKVPPRTSSTWSRRSATNCSSSRAAASRRSVASRIAARVARPRGGGFPPPWSGEKPGPRRYGTSGTEIHGGVHPRQRAPENAVPLLERQGLLYDAAAIGLVPGDLPAEVLSVLPRSGFKEERAQVPGREPGTRWRLHQPNADLSRRCRSALLADLKGPASEPPPFRRDHPHPAPPEIRTPVRTLKLPFMMSNSNPPGRPGAALARPRGPQAGDVGAAEPVPGAADRHHRRRADRPGHRP